MPGFIFDCAKPDVVNSWATRLLQFDNRYYYQSLWNVEHATFGINSYDKYPFSTIDLMDYRCMLEGCVYNQNVDEILRYVVTEIDKGNVQEALKYVANIDGEFVIILHHKKSNDWYFLNDCWGRLPVYYRIKMGKLTCARDISYLTGINSGAELSLIDAALYTMFGYTLDDSTIYKDIRKLSPNTILKYSPATDEMTSLSGFEFSNLFRNRVPPSIETLSVSLKNAIFSRLDFFDLPSLSLSGGLDSRLIAGCLADMQQCVPLTTFDRNGEHYQADLNGARQIAERLQMNKKHEIVSIPKTSRESREKLFDIKQGMNGLDMAFILPYLERLSGTYDSSITGDGGDKFLVDLRPYSSLSSQKKVINYIIEKHSALSPRNAAELFGIDSNGILERIYDSLTKISLTTPNEIYAAFVIRNRGMNWLFEGEDRNRHFLWSTSPFYCPEVVKESMSFSMESKKNGALFKKLFLSLPGNLETIVNPNWKLALDDNKGIARLMTRQRIKSKLSTWIHVKQRSEESFLHFCNHSFQNVPKILRPAVNSSLKVPLEVSARLKSLFFASLSEMEK